MVTIANPSTRSDPTGADMDDLQAYVNSLGDEEREELEAAESAIDISILLHRARVQRGLSQTAAADLTGLKQQAISRLENLASNPRLDTIRSYLSLLGYDLEVRAIDRETGEVAATATLPPVASPSGQRP